MDPFAELLEDVERTITAQATCSDQAIDVVTKCLEEVQSACVRFGGGSSKEDVVGAASRALSQLKVDSKLASGTKNLHKLVGNLGKVCKASQSLYHSIQMLRTWVRSFAC